MCLCLDRMRPFCMLWKRQPLTASPAVVHDSCPSLLASWSLTSDPPLSRCAVVGAGWRCWWMTGIGLRACHYLTVQRSLPLVSIKVLKPLCSSPYYLTSKAVNSMIKCAYKIRGLNISSIQKFLPLLSLSFSLFSFFFWLESLVFRWLLQDPGSWICCHGEKKVNCCLLWSEFQTAQHESEQLCQLSSRTCLAFYQLLAIFA